ncbi:alpha/beta hydrolase [Bacillus sp. B15-48]|uniref:alpha/beta hydrolase n=1 Tax=Bacillus sp. B15-48 TaxID=1548601 RepID=UPI00193FEAA7|nr:alpha/beta hydrolase [Bacillus sp. B15-48]MBM4762197.1 alpha/beta hydrolase [Bacillus sp. B15-48]
MKKLLRFLFSFFILLTAFGVYFTNRIMFIKKKKEEDIVFRDEKAGFMKNADFKSLPQRKVSITSPFGYSLQAIAVEPWNTNRYMIFCHGVTENKMSSVKYMNLFIERGFNAVIYDQRRHGESGGKTTSYGYYEKFDLKAVVDWLNMEKGSNLFLGIHGESMGAATMLQYAGALEDGADFYIADCPYSDFSEQLAYRVKEEVNLPPKMMIPLARLFLKVRDRYHLSHVSPISSIEKIHNPVLFIHSKKDDYILPNMTQELYHRKRGPKQLFLAKNGLHARSLSENREEYERALDDFLDKASLV